MFAYFLQRFFAGLMRCKKPAQSSCFLGSQIKRLIFFVLVKQTEIHFLLLVHYNICTCNSLPYNTAARYKNNYDLKKFIFIILI